MPAGSQLFTGPVAYISGTVMDQSGSCKGKLDKAVSNAVNDSFTVCSNAVGVKVANLAVDLMPAKELLAVEIAKGLAAFGAGLETVGILIDIMAPGFNHGAPGDDGITYLAESASTEAGLGAGRFLIGYSRFFMDVGSAALRLESRIHH